MISLKNIRKSYGEQKVLEGFDLNISDGSRTAVMGRSGAGKTTLISIVAGLVKPDSGEVSVKGKLGMVFQEDRLIDSLNAVGNCRIVIGRADYGEPEKVLEVLGIKDGLEKKPVSELSGGERRRVAIARALVYRPEILLMDEPFKGIDTATIPSVVGEILKMTQGCTVVLVTHSEEEAKLMGAEIIRI